MQNNMSMSIAVWCGVQKSLFYHGWNTSTRQLWAWEAHKPQITSWASFYPIRGKKRSSFMSRWFQWPQTSLINTSTTVIFAPHCALMHTKSWKADFETTNRGIEHFCDHIFFLFSLMSVHKNWTLFKEIIIQHARDHIARTYISVNISKPWFTESLHTRRNKKRRLYINTKNLGPPA